MSKKPTSKTKQAKVKSSKVSTLVFLATLIVTLISLTTVLFPSLLVRSTSQFNDIVINPHETGVWTYPVLVANFILLAIGILYFKNKLPQQITKSIQFVFNFEVSKKLAFISFVILLAIYAGFTVGELASEETWEDYKSGGISAQQGVKDRVAGWSFNDIKNSPADPHFRYMLLSFSLNMLGNIRIIPFIASIALLITTYFITKEISQKRFAGLVSVAFVLQSSVFLTYDTSATYDNIWFLLYLVSLYTIFKKWPLSPISYIASIPAKALTALFLPMTLFFIYRTKASKQKKIRLAISYAVIIGVVIVAYTITNSSTSNPDANDFWRGFTAWAFQLRFDGVVLIFILPLIVGLYLASRRGIMHADSILVLIMGVLLSAPVLQGFSDFTNQPYRFVPLVVFFAMGIGTILSKRTSEQV